MPSDTKLKFSEYIDLLLARLYELEQGEGDGQFHDLNEITKELKDPPPKQWVFDAGKVLEGRGLAQCVFVMGGGCHAMLTGEGRLFVEEERGTGIINQYKQKPSNFVIVSGDRNQVVVGSKKSKASQSTVIEREREPSFDLLKSIRNTIVHDNSVNNDEKEELLLDLQMIERQLKKRQPNRSVLASLLEPLSQLTSIAGHVAQLIKLLNP